MAKDYSAITPDILKLSELCSGNSVINSEMYLEHKVFRGLRDLNGNGVLTGLTEVSEIQSFQVGENGEKHPVPRTAVLPRHQRGGTGRRLY